MRVQVLVHHSVRPVQIDGFGSEVERSAEGAIYFWPNSIKHITEGELGHIKKKHPWLASNLILVKVEKEETPKPKIETSASVFKEPDAKPEPDKSSRKPFRSTRKRSKDTEEED